jgi:hypothetical protein
MRIVDVRRRLADPWCLRARQPERADRSDVSGVEEDVGEARQTRIGSGSELAGGGLDPFCEVGEVELEAVCIAFRLVLPAVDDHEPGAHVDQEREA